MSAWNDRYLYSIQFDPRTLVLSFLMSSAKTFLLIGTPSLKFLLVAHVSFVYIKVWKGRRLGFEFHLITINVYVKVLKHYYTCFSIPSNSTLSDNNFQYLLLWVLCQHITYIYYLLTRTAVSFIMGDNKENMVLALVICMEFILPGTKDFLFE